MEIFETIDAVVLVQHKAQAGDMLRYLSKQETVFNEQMIKTILKQIIDKVALLHKIGIGQSPLRIHPQGPQAREHPLPRRGAQIAPVPV